MDKLEQLIEKAIPLPTCPQKKIYVIADRVWLKKEIKKLYEKRVQDIELPVYANGPKEIK